MSGHKEVGHALVSRGIWRLVMSWSRLASWVLMCSLVPGCGGPLTYPDETERLSAYCRCPRIRRR
jgi:hypothetical protein